MGDGLAARAAALHIAAGRGDAAAEDELTALGWRDVRAGQCVIDVTLGWHRHADRPGALSCCDDTGCAEALDPVVFAASWEAWWPPGQPPRA